MTVNGLFIHVPQSAALPDCGGAYGSTMAAIGRFAPLQALYVDDCRTVHSGHHQPCHDKVASEYQHTRSASPESAVASW